jgi:hypothetical protein
MSSSGALSGAGARAPNKSGGRKRGRPFGSKNREKDPATTPPVPHRHGRPPGSRNKKTLSALVAAAAAESARAVLAAAVAAAPARAVAPAATNTVAPAGAPSVAGLTATSLEAAAALVGAMLAVGAASPGLVGRGIGGSSGAAAAKARKPRRTPPQQRLSYTPKHRFTTAMVHLRARCQERLPLPASFVGTMGRSPSTSIMVEEGSGGQPLYLVEILHDEQGKSYLTDGWMKFIDDYDLKCGWSLILTHHAGSHVLCVYVIDTSGCVIRLKRIYNF